MITVKLYQRKSRKRPNGEAPVFYVLSHGSKRKEIATGKYVHIDHFDNESGLVKKGKDNAMNLNAWFRKQLATIDKIILDQLNDEKPVTLDIIEHLFHHDGSYD